MNRFFVRLSLAVALFATAACAGGDDDATLTDTTTIPGRDTVQVPTTVPTTDTIVTDIDVTRDTIRGDVSADTLRRTP